MALALSDRLDRRARGFALAAGILISILGMGASSAVARDLPAWLGTPEWSEEGRWMGGVGWFGLRTHDPQSVVFDLEYRWSGIQYGVYPLAGVLANTDGAWHVRAGLGRDFEFPGPWDLTITAAAGYYERGQSKVLGHEVEFRTSLDITYTVRPDLRLGLTLAHLSNSRLSESNPGVENLSFTVIYRP